jgi:amidophosphoribosyltransferase
VFGIIGTGVPEAVSAAYFALYALQHRGQESCGIAVNRGGYIYGHKDTGLVNEVFTRQVLDELCDTVAARSPQNPDAMCAAVGHVRYGTTGGSSRANAQPMVVYHMNGGMALAHNGNLTNAAELRRELELNGAIFHSTSDTEVISYIITRERAKTSGFADAVLAAVDRIRGAYSLVITSGEELVGVRDVHGFRPLCVGKLCGGYVFASESCALDTVGAEFVRDVLPGEVVVAGRDGLRSIKDRCGAAPHTLCVFEFIYFARPDSVVEGASIHLARRRLGEYLACAHSVEADVVIGVPDSGLDGAMGYAKASGIPYEMGFIKNKYIGRSFIRPTQAQRANDVRIKLNPVTAVVSGKRVVMVDDSIVRGTTCARIVKLLRDAGATEVHMRVTAPPFVNACYFGTDIDSPESLIAANREPDEIAKLIGADSLGYLGLDCVKKLGDELGIGFCDACFSGNYPIKPLSPDRKSKFERKIAE